MGRGVLVILLAASAIYPAEKLAQTGFQFLSVATDARGGALGDAMTTSDFRSSSLFFNPAGMARMQEKVDLALTQNQWIADITHNSFSLALNPANGRYGVIGFSAISVDYGEIQGTIVSQNAQGYMDTEIIEPTAFCFGLGYAKALSTKFSVGGQLKYTGQNLGRNYVPVGEDSLTVRKNLAFASAVDFGTIYQTGFKSLAFGMSVRNFSEETEFEKESFQLPLTFSIGISMDLFDLMEDMDNMGLRMSIDAVHPRSYPEYVKVGLEYNFSQTLFLRAGYQSNRDEESFSYGFGIQRFGLGMDYAYTPFGLFDNVQRFTIRFLI